MIKLIVNVGSTSVKTQLFDAKLQVMAWLNADYGAKNGLIIEGQDLRKIDFSYKNSAIHDAKNTLNFLFQHWQEWLNQNSITLNAMGHRVVHGGTHFKKATLITPDVLAQIQQLDAYAPLHNPLNRLGIEMAGELFKDIKQFAVFDTAFHRNIPEYAGRYAISEKLSPQIDFYRYGFHGISCQHSVNVAANLLNKSPNELNVIILHLGGGASATAVKNGKSVDTSMGFSPTEGLIMASRCGDIDPMISITLQREGKSLDEINQLLNKHSGLNGICGETDMRTILHNATCGEKTCQLAIDMFCYRIQKYIGNCFAVLNGCVDALIFTGGIGENAPAIRYQILTNLNGLGFSLDVNLNQQKLTKDSIISDSASTIKILAIHAQEEREIAKQMLSI